MSVRHALLGMLSDGPKYGLQLRQEFEARTGEVWPLNVGQVYTTLQRLERDGLVESDDAESDGPQKGFRITSAGEGELMEWLRTPGGVRVRALIEVDGETIGTEARLAIGISRAAQSELNGPITPSTWGSAAISFMFPAHLSGSKLPDWAVESSQDWKATRYRPARKWCCRSTNSTAWLIASVGARGPA